MEILNLEVINLDWFFEKLMLNLFDCNVLAVDKLQLIACSQLDSGSPAFFGCVELVTRRADDFFIVHKDVSKLFGFVDESVFYLFLSRFSCFRIGGYDHIAHSNAFNRNKT